MVLPYNEAIHPGFSGIWRYPIELVEELPRCQNEFPKDGRQTYPRKVNTGSNHNLVFDSFVTSKSFTI